MAKKKTYRKPEIKQVELVPEEAVLGFCKMGTGSTRETLCNASPGACVNSAPGS